MVYGVFFKGLDTLGTVRRKNGAYDAIYKTVIRGACAIEEICRKHIKQSYLVTQQDNRRNLTAVLRFLVDKNIPEGRMSCKV